MESLDRFAADKLTSLENKALRRILVQSAREDGIWVVRNGRRLLSFSCNDYLNLSQHPAVKQAAIEAIARYGVGAGASRLVTGNHPLYTELEAKLARLKMTEAVCVFGAGYLANAGIVPALVGEDDAIFIDALAHSSIWSGAQLSHAHVYTFRHNDVADLEALLTRHRTQHARAVIATEGVFSMDGDLAPLPELASLAGRFDAWLMSDDAHAVGVIGSGRGSSFAFESRPEVPLQMGTLSKAIGSYGGYLCASRNVIDLMTTRARTLIYSTGLPPAAVAAASAAIDIIASEPAHVALPLAKAKTFTTTAGLPPATSAIVPVIVGEAEAALAASRFLEDEGFLVAAIRAPTVPAGTARLRLAFTAGHSDTDIMRLAAIVSQKILRR